MVRAPVRNGAFLSLLALLLSAGAAQAQTKNVRIMMDWVIQGTHAPFFVADEKGYFKSEGLSVAIDAGKGATNTAVSVAGGVYQMGYGDLPTMIRFNAQNPASPLTTVYVSFDESPNAIVSLKSKGIRTPADLEGKKIAGGPGAAVHDTISILLNASGNKNVKINWVPVTPQLFPSMLRKGEVDGLGAFTNSQIPGLLDLGFKMDELAVLKYSDFGANLYGLGLVVTQKFADENPETVRGMVRAFNRGLKDTIANPDQALAIMKARDPLTKIETEKVRLQIVLGHTVTPHVAQNGLSSVTPARLKQNIDATVAAYQLTRTPEAGTVYTEKFLPSAAERAVPKK
jgi:NitT/TauT family transport system substrate-binding protein